jgi:hypothetical protein
MTPLHIVRPEELAQDAGGVRWLVKPLWAAEAVGILAGSPKAGKSWLALDLAVGVASRTYCLDALPIQDDGPVLVYAAEDAQPILRERLAALVAVRGISLETLRVSVIVEPVLRLDTERDQARLAETVRLLRPRLVVLDPLIRLHRLDENSSREVSALLSYFRQLQREYSVALLLVHHMRKGGGSRPGENLRGSSDLHAWGDTLLYLRRTQEGIHLTVEHRAHPSPQPMLLHLQTEPHPHLVLATAAAVAPSVADEIVALLDKSAAPLPTRRICATVRGRTEATVAALHALAARGAIRRTPDGWTTVRAPPNSTPFPVSHP